MEVKEKTPITVKTTVNAPLNKVWESWTKPEHITKWNQASDDWHCPAAENDLRTGGKFSATMAAKDGSFSFDYSGVYTHVEPMKRIDSELGDGRKVSVIFNENNNQTEITETFDAEETNPKEMQRDGWQAILNSFKRYTESV